jgi:hypothetical protein
MTATLLRARAIFSFARAALAANQAVRIEGDEVLAGDRRRRRGRIAGS